MNSNVWRNIGVCSCPAKELCEGRDKDSSVLTVLFMFFAVSLRRGQILKLDSALCKGLPVPTSIQELHDPLKNVCRLRYSLTMPTKCENIGMSHI